MQAVRMATDAKCNGISVEAGKKAHLMQTKLICSITWQTEMRPRAAKFDLSLLETQNKAHFSCYRVKCVSSAKRLSISYVLTVLKRSSIYPGESAGTLCLYGKLDVKCTGPNTHVPHKKRYKIRGTAELDVLYDFTQTQHLGRLWRDHFLSLRLHLK